LILIYFLDKLSEGRSVCIYQRSCLSSWFP